MMISLQMLREEFTSKDTVELIDTLESCTRRGAELVKQVLSFARGLEGERIAVNFEILLRDVRQIVRETFPKSIEFRFSTEKDLWLVQGDPTQLHQVVMNLAVNARDAMPHGGRLHLSAENVVLDEVYSGMNQQASPGPYVRIVVNDTGEGISPEIIDRIFEPFFTTKETGKGTGLGLSTTMGLVRSHGGFINVYSEPGRGATFKIYLPASASPHEKKQVELKQTGLPRGRGQQILVVDDEQSIRDVARRTLERFGYRVMTAEHGAEAVALYAQHGSEIDAVICDMAMPVMDGPATIVAIKAINPRVRLIASSGFTENQGVTKALGIGASQFINKPYTSDQLLTALDRLWTDSPSQPGTL